jgi:hypothetical protein
MTWGFMGATGRAQILITRQETDTRNQDLMNIV